MTNIPEQDDESQQLLRDLLALSAMPNETIAVLASDLQGQSPFVSLQSLLNKHVSNSEASEAIARLITNLDVDAIPLATQWVQTWRESFDEDKRPLSDDDFNLFTRNLSTLLQPSTIAVVRRTQKAASLLLATGNQITGLAFVCDVRPVYNEDKSDIEGFVPLTTMKLYFDRPNAEKEAVEIVLSADQLDEVFDRVARARDKLSVMQSKFSAWLPNGNVGGAS